MKSIRSVYKIGHGPSSSHTVGPYIAAQEFGKRFPEADSFEVTLYGSLAFTGEGHGTGKAVRSGLPGAKVLLDKEKTDLPHPNTMLFKAFKDGNEIVRKVIMSIGGGTIKIEGEDSIDDQDVYPERNFTEIVMTCNAEGTDLVKYIYAHELNGLRMYLTEIWHAMQASIRRGLSKDGILPGGLNISRRAKLLFEKRCYNESADITINRKISSYAYAAAEENASKA